MFRIAIEGLSGAGKTSTVTSIIQTLSENVLLLPELNPPPHVLRSGLELTWESYHLLWKHRLEALKSFKNNMKIIFDRTFYSNLAFTYAMGDVSSYNKQKDIITSDFSHNYFDIMIVLIVNPQTGIERRLDNKDHPHYPWNNLNFLKKMRIFYTEQLQKIYKNKILFIETTKQEPEKIVSCVRKWIDASPINSCRVNIKKISKEIENRLLQFAMEERLGAPYTKAIRILDCPTIYFRQYAIQFHKDKPTYLDTLQLSKLSNFCYESGLF